MALIWPYGAGSGLDWGRASARGRWRHIRWGSNMARSRRAIFIAAGLSFWLAGGLALQAETVPLPTPAPAPKDRSAPAPPATQPSTAPSPGGILGGVMDLGAAL